MSTFKEPPTGPSIEELMGESTLEFYLPTLLSILANKEFVPFRSVFTGEKYEDLVAYVNEHTGLTEKKFNANSRKSLRSLFGELQDFDCQLKQANNGSLLRFASNARTEIYAREEDLYFREVARVFRESGKRVDHSSPREYGASETMRRKPLEESPRLAAVRGIKEEFGLVFSEDSLVPLASIPVGSVHESTAFAQTTSIVLTWRFKLTIPSIKDWESEKIIKVDGYQTIRDGDVLVCSKWLPGT